MFYHMIKKASFALLAALMVLTLAAPGLSFAASTSAPSDAAAKALDWMKNQQQADGSFPGFGAGSTVDALLAIEAAGIDPSTFSKGGKTPVDFLQSKLTDLIKTPGSMGKLLLAIAPLGKVGINTNALLDAINKNYPPSGHYGQDAIGHAFAMLGLAAAGAPVSPKAVTYLQSVQGSDGGWAFSGDTKPGSSDTNTTAVAVQALIAAGVPATDASLQKALAYLNSQANDDGGFPYQKGSADSGDSDVNSTSYVTQALLALHADATKPLAFLQSMQKPDGAFQWMKSQPDDNAGATYQAIPALLGVTLVRQASIQAPPASQPPTTGQGSTTPGMPSTGDSTIFLLPAAVSLLLAVSILGCGLAVRRRSVVK